MGKQGFDQRYPAMFQPGGEEWPVPEPAIAGSVPPEPLPQVIPPSVLAIAAAGNVAGNENVDDEPRSELAAVATAEQAMPWGSRVWLAGGAMALLSLAAAVFCFVAVTLIPSAREWNMNGESSSAATPWGYPIFPGAAAFLTASAGMLAAMLLLGSWQFGSRWLRAGAAVVGLVALAGGMVGFFGGTFWPEMFYGSYQTDPSNVPFQWPMLLQSIGSPLSTLGLMILSVVVIVRPDGVRKGHASGRKALSVAFILVAAALWAWFCPTLFPEQSLNTPITVDGNEFWAMPWTGSMMQAGGPLAMVAAGVLMWAALLLASSTSARDTASQDEDIYDEDEA